MDLLQKNRILEGLPLSEREVIDSSWELQEMHLGDVIEEAGRPIRFLRFPIDCAISVTNVQDQEHTVEVTVTGKEGATGSSIVLGSDRSPSMALVQIGGTAIRVPASEVLNRLPRLPYLNAALARHNLLLLNLAVISVGCSQFHSPPERVARWLKAHWHRTGIESFPFSNEFLAVQVGVDRKIVAEALEDFQQQGIVQQKRNNVTITDQEALGRQACQCFALSKESTEDYLRSLGELAQIYR